MPAFAGEGLAVRHGKSGNSDLDEDVRARLRMQAAEHGRSLEAEVHAILVAAVRNRRPVRRLGSHIHGQFAEVGGFELDIPARSVPVRPIELNS